MMIPERGYDEMLFNENDKDAPEIGTPECLIEDGLALIARGLFRTKEQEGIKAAADSASSVSNVLTAMHLDFYRLANK